MVGIPDNISHFNRVILELLVRLYDAFPHPLNIDSLTNIAIGFGSFSHDASDIEDLSTGTLADDVMEWLKEEGFIRYDPDPNYRPGTFWKVRLTLKALTILGYVPALLKQTDTKEPFIQKARQAITSSDSNGETESIEEVVGEIFKLALAQRKL